MRNYIVDYLDNYFSSDLVLERTPLLVGPSSTAKSALVKEAAKAHNFRVVDVRLSFMSRLDIMGLSEKIEVDGKYYSDFCPMLNLIKCTDAYVNTARESLKLVKEEYNKATGENKAKLERTVKKLEEESKTPVLFFDEVTRGEASVRQVFTKILTDKAFLGYPMTIARVIAATNSQLDASGEPVDIYMTNNTEDVAFFDRFQSIYVSPSSVQDYWLAWAKKNLDSNVYSQAEEYPYDEFHFTSMDLEDAIVTPYKCYRTWEMLSNYYKAGGSNPYYSQYVVGNLCGKKLTMDTFISESVKTGTPALVISPSGLGKTSRINKLCKDNNYEMISINLSEVDRIDLEGMPVKVRTLKSMFENMPLTKTLAEKIREIATNFGLPEYSTTRAPKKEYVDAFQRAIDSGRRTVIYFDEVNRVQNVSVMSAVFQVISDHRLFGIDFDPNKVSCILSCNLDDNCADAQSLDPALVSRFAIWRKKDYTSGDSSNFIDYMNNNYPDSIVTKYIMSLDGSDSLKLINSVNFRTLEISAPSTRGLKDLAETLKRVKNPILDAHTLIGSIDDYRELSGYIRTHETDKIVGYVTKMRDMIDKWSYKELNGKAVIYKNIIKAFESKSDSEIANDNVTLNAIINLDNQIWEYLRDYFRMYVGANTNDFTDFYVKAHHDNESFTELEVDSVREKTSHIAETHNVRSVVKLADSLTSLCSSNGTDSGCIDAFWKTVSNKMTSDELIQVYTLCSTESRNLLKDCSETKEYVFDHMPALEIELLPRPTR